MAELATRGNHSEYFDASRDGRLVCASERCEEGGALCGQGFRVVIRPGDRFLVTWAGAIYLIPTECDLVDVACACLALPGMTIGRVPDGIQRAYSIREVTDAEFESLGLSDI